MPVYEINPRQDPRWAVLVESHPHSSIFHTPEWLDALYRTYGYKATAFTMSPAEVPLTNGIVFCNVRSWLTGSRLVSLPFSDHCEPLVQNAEDLGMLLSEVGKKAMVELKHAEIRPRSIELSPHGNFGLHRQYYLHVIDLKPSTEELYSRLHKAGVQRKIRRAGREGVALEQGRSKAMLQEFYQLLLLTRRRHKVLPQPFAWFRNLTECLGLRLTIHVARVDGRPIGGILTLRHKKTLVYKYGCSDERFHRLGIMPRLFWQAIQEAKSEQLQEFDLGRSEQGNEGLVRFKDHLGATKTTLSYWRSSRKLTNHATVLLPPRLAEGFLSRLPDCLFRLAGQVLYRHVG